MIDINAAHANISFKRHCVNYDLGQKPDILFRASKCHLRSEGLGSEPLDLNMLWELISVDDSVHCSILILTMQSVSQLHGRGFKGAKQCFSLCSCQKMCFRQHFLAEAPTIYLCVLLKKL